MSHSDPPEPAKEAEKMIDDAILDQATALLARCRDAGLMIATAESCTGGLIAAALTAISGSSDVVDRGFVTYSNAAKTELLGVPASLIEAAGAVSEEVARAMAEGALARSAAALAVSVTGIAGPGGGAPGKPVGLVWLGCIRRGRPAVTLRQVFSGDRTAVRRATVAHALDMLDHAARR
jgi:nicotinamide-nucleotide amidase